MIGIPQGSPSGALSGGKTSARIFRTIQATVPDIIEANPPALVALFQAKAAMRAGVIATPYIV